MFETQYHTVNLSNYTFLVTGGAGFIGSNLVEYLLKYNAKKVKILDNFSTGFHDNIEEFKSHPSFELIEGDIRNIEICYKAAEGIDYILHQAALGSVNRSLKDPITTNDVNITGFLNILTASRDLKVKRLIYASSSSTYGDSDEIPKKEDIIGKPLSPYAITKYVNELYAEIFSKLYGIETIGLRYFNVFGPKQNPQGEYAAVIPKFIIQLLNHNSPVIYGDGEITRDFTFIENAVQANILATFVKKKEALNTVYNIACGENNTLNQLIKHLKEYMVEYNSEIKNIKIKYGDNRIGDILYSLASIDKAYLNLGYKPLFKFKEGLKLSIQWYIKNISLYN